MDVGFIGLGSMGVAMVPHLVRAGHRVSVWNRNPAAAQSLQGVTILRTAAEAFDNDAVLTMLGDDRAVRAVVLAPGVLAKARPGCVHGVMATISLALVAELQEAHREAAVAYVAAPVFGVPAVAAAAGLNIVAAGPADALAVVQPLFDVLGTRTWPLGADQAKANVAKIGGNLMIALAIEAMGEASALTERYGLAAADFLDIMTNTLFASPSYQRYGGNIARNSYQPGFKLTLGLKDVDLALEAAAAKGATLPAATVVGDTLREAVREGLDAADWSALARITHRRAGVEDSAA